MKSYALDHPILPPILLGGSFPEFSYLLYSRALYMYLCGSYRAAMAQCCAGGRPGCAACCCCCCCHGVCKGTPKVFANGAIPGAGAPKRGLPAIAGVGVLYPKRAGFGWPVTALWQSPWNCVTFH